MKTYDHIILGTGQATGTLLGQLIPSGDSIAVIEQQKVGGSCVNYGCTPTKTLVASARAFHQAKRGGFFGFSTSAGPTLAYDRVRERMNEVRNSSSEGLANWMEESENVELIYGRGYFVGERRLQVGDRQIEGKKIYVNVGTRPRLPKIEGFDEVPWMDSARLLDKPSLPEHLLVLGGGYIGTELAQVYRRFGAEVTIIQSADQLMPREDEDVATSIHDFLTEEGVKIEYGARAEAVSWVYPNIQISVNQAGQTRVIEGTDLLIAIGRVPNSDTIAPEAIGLQLDERGYIKVDDYCQNNVPGVYALGDVNGQGAFTHTAVNDAEIVLDHLNGGGRKISDRIPIYALFTDPPLGRVGMSEKEALDKCDKVLKATRPMAKISRAKEMGETAGFAKLLVDGETDLVLGASILGVGGDEIINMFATIMHSQIPCREYRRVVLVHPTVSELMPWILDGIKEAGEKA
ncbi:MAG: mercuric reductase [Bacteroidota bacterium]